MYCGFVYSFCGDDVGVESDGEMRPRRQTLRKHRKKGSPMLTKRNDLMTTAARGVKKTGITLLSALAISTAVAAPSAHAFDTQWVETTVKVRFNKSDLQAEGGLEQVYEKLERKASRACTSDKTSVAALGQTLAQCEADLLSQFVESADIQKLSTYHQSQASLQTTKKYALNAG
jgi:UrcA family protein